VSNSHQGLGGVSLHNNSSRNNKNNSNNIYPTKEYNRNSNREIKLANGSSNNNNRNSDDTCNSKRVSLTRLLALRFQPI
jgi:hypothetical protein